MDGVNKLASTLGVTATNLSSYAQISELSQSDPVYDQIVRYVKNSQCHGAQYTFSVNRIFKVNVNNTTRPRGHRMLLWHGTKKQFVESIITKGFFLPQSGHTGLMYGAGVYFADRSSKSAGYCDSTRSGQLGYMFLCDVLLDKTYKAKNAHNDYTNPPKGFDCVKGMGKFIPTWRDNEYYGETIIPLGITKQNTRFDSFNLNYNEYIVYDNTKCVILFLVEIKFA